MSTRDARVVFAFDVAHALRTPRGLLFLVFYALTVGWFLSLLHRHRDVLESLVGSADLPQAVALKLLGWLLGDEASLRAHLREHPPLVVFYGHFALATLPLFAMLGSFDQTANDLATRHVRFLLLKTDRGSIYAGRLAGAYVLVAAPVAIVTLGWGAYAGDPLHAARLALTLATYALPFVALMAFLAAATASAAVALLVGSSWQIVVWTAATFLPLADERYRAVAYLFPSAARPMLAAASMAAWGAGLALALGYATLFAALGWWVFARRDT